MLLFITKKKKKKTCLLKNYDINIKNDVIIFFSKYLSHDIAKFC